MNGHVFRPDAKSGIRFCERCGEPAMQRTSDVCRVIDVPAMTDEQREYVEALLRPAPVDLGVVIGGPRRCQECGEVIGNAACAACAEKQELLRRAFPRLHGDA